MSESQTKQRYFVVPGTEANPNVKNKKTDQGPSESRLDTDPPKKKHSTLRKSQKKSFKKFKFDGTKRSKPKRDPDDPYPSEAPLPKLAAAKYSRGKGIGPSSKRNFKTVKTHKQVARKDKKIVEGIKQAARNEILLTEEAGKIVTEDWEHTLQLKQCDIKKEVDIASAAKQFDLNLHQFAPYCLDYTLNGKYLVIGGRKGHVAAFDWVTKRLTCEVGVNESVYDVQWLHNENMFAVAQKNWTYIYDNKGTEIHCLKRLHKVYSLDFLPYHFLLVAGHETGLLSWVDVSIGKIVSQYVPKGAPSPSVLTTNPANAVTVCGHSNGTVSFWSPSVNTYLASMLCHGAPVSAIAVDSVGRLMATGGHDGLIKVWDLRNNFAPLTSTRVGVISNLNFSQRGLLAASTKNQVLIFSEIGDRQKPYLKHVAQTPVTSMKFCPFEDVLGLGNYSGVQSILVPGAGEANFDALERNPFQTKSQRREAEVKQLLEKIQPELISMDNNILGEIDTETLQADLDSKPRYVKKADIDLAHRMRRKASKLPKIKQGLQNELNLKNAREAERKATIANRVEGREKEAPVVHDDPLDRFKSKQKRPKRPTH